MGIGPNKVYSYISVAIIGFLPLASFLIFGAQWSHLALFCQKTVLLLSDGRIPDSHAFWVMTSRTFSFLGGGVGSLCSLLSSFSIFSTCQVGRYIKNSFKRRKTLVLALISLVLHNSMHLHHSQCFYSVKTQKCA